MSFIQWITTPAHWWQFWLPQSGLAGGVIGGLLLALVMAAVFP